MSSCAHIFHMHYCIQCPACCSIGSCRHVVGHTFGQLRVQERKKVTEACTSGRKPLAVRNTALGELKGKHFAAGVRYNNKRILLICYLNEHSNPVAC